MTGAQLLLQTLSEQGVEMCFANPGTTELDLVRAMEHVPQMRSVIGLQENICTGAADGYGRMKGKPACTLLHLGPGFANGIANLHNARRARTPIINIIGDQTSWHLPFDAPLTSDIESLAHPVSGWVHRVTSAQACDVVAKEAVKQTSANGGQGVSIIFPADYQAEETVATGSSHPSASPATRAQSLGNIAALVDTLLASRHLVFLLGGGGADSALSARGQMAVARLCEILPAKAYAETFPSRSERGQGLPAFDRLPYFPEPARQVLDAADRVVLVGALPPVTYFGYPGQPSQMVEDERLLTVCQPGEDAVTMLEALVAALNAPAYQAPNTTLLPEPQGALTPAAIGVALSRALPPHAVVSVEGGTCGYPFYAVSHTAAVHTTLTNTGGAIGQGLPAAMGAALACPDRKVVALLSDGSTQYTIQTLWSLAHENLNVLVLIAANHQYAILRNELRRGGAALSAQSETMTALDNPRIDWVGLANAYGVRGVRVQSSEELTAQLATWMQYQGPALIEMSL